MHVIKRHKKAVANPVLFCQIQKFGEEKSGFGKILQEKSRNGRD